MKNFNSPAVVIHEGTEHPVQAALWGDYERVTSQAGGVTETLRGLEHWGGTITGLDGDTSWAIYNGSGRAILRIGEREGEFLPKGFSNTGGPIQFSGSGRAPFDID